MNAAGPDPVERERAGEIETRWLADSVRLTVHFILGEERAGERVWWPSYGF